MRDVAGGAHLVLQGVARGAELAARVRRVDELAAETAASRRRLEVAREVERRRLVTELQGATAERLAAFRQAVTDAADGAGGRRGRRTPPRWRATTSRRPASG